MKQVVSNYSYSPATNVLTLSGVNIDQDQLLLVVAPGVGRTMYNFASGVTGVVSAGINTRVTLNASTASLTTTSPLVIYYDDQLTNNSVTISSLPAISGTVTANVFGKNIDGSVQLFTANDGGARTYDGGGAIAVGFNDNENGAFAHVSTDNPFPISVKFAADVGETMPPQAIALGFYSGDDAGIAAVNDVNRKLPISGTVTIGNSVTIGSAIPAGTNRIGVVTIGGGTVTIGAGTAQIGTVTASLQFTTTAGQWVQDGLTKILQQDLCPGLYQNDIQPYGVPIAFIDPGSQGYPIFRVVGNNGNSLPVTITTGYNRIGVVTIGNSVTVGSLPVQLSTTTIGGTARLNVTLSSATTIGSTAPSYGNLYGGSDGTNFRAINVDTSGRTVVTGSVSVANTVPVSGTFWQATQPVSGTVTANISGTVPVSISSVTIGNTVTVAGTVTANIASTTVTISAQPSGALTTRFGSVTTANTAQITTAVTNTSRKYLLAQNISTGTVTIGIGFSPTTTQGIQLTAGAGLTFDSFVPTGAVYWLGATTSAAYTILEG